MAFVIPIMVPACMLHIWLWLQHPRTRQHYWIFTGLMAVPVVLFIMLPLIGNAIYARDGHGSAGLISTEYLPGMLFMLAGAGVVPILYRFVTFNGIVPLSRQFRDQTSPRASIIDGLALVLMCAFVFSATQIINKPSRYDYSPLWSLIVTVLVSLLAIVAMRINARCSRAQMFANVAAIWIGGWLALKSILWGIEAVMRSWLGGLDPGPSAGASWLFINHRSDWEELASGFGTFAIAIFPIVCRKYGLVLIPIRERKKQVVDGNLDESDFIYAPEGGAWLGRLAGHLCLLVMIAMLTLYPFTRTGEYSIEGYRIAGWPLVYWHAEQTIPSSAAWYWTDSSIWQSTEFDQAALMIDVLLTLAVSLVILPLPSLYRRVSPRSVFTARWTLGAAFVIAVSWDVFLSTIYSDWRLSRMESVTVNDYISEGDFTLLQRVAHDLDTQWRGTEDRLKRGGPRDITIHGATADEVDAAIRLAPSLKVLTLKNCDLPTDRVSELAADTRFDNFTFENDGIQDCGVVRAVRSGRDFGIGESYTLELIANGGEIVIPDGVRELQIVIPHRRDSVFDLKGMADLYSLKVRNTFGDVPNSVCRIRIEHAPNLELIRLDTMQRFALELESIPQLKDLYGFTNEVGSAGARLTDLKLSGVVDLESIFLDLTELTAIQLKGMDDRLHLKQLYLGMDSIVQSPKNVSRRCEDVQQLLTPLSVIRSANNLELRGLVCDHTILRDLPMVTNALTLNDCIFLDDVNAGAYEQFVAITHLNIENLVATSQQIHDLESCAIDTVVVNKRDDFRIDAIIKSAMPRVVSFPDWHYSPYGKMAQHLADLTEYVRATGKPGRFNLRIADLRHIVPWLQTMIDDARMAGVKVRINP
ncbi:hypothetical protein [Neorhodopirellula pilleata]|uniref:hypothetical protein n=1 Tax=Neorhodopirellula pilleata TaxID=2714738 RepID=UPI001E3A3B7A|nr:hypothetical protein [Neorhodopirellula pilleata]